MVYYRHYCGSILYFNTRQSDDLIIEVNTHMNFKFCQESFQLEVLSVNGSSGGRTSNPDSH